ncbi:hypothetical protein [uncultured Thiodictyon sp.]|jgi:predicted nucleic acid-binding protein|uniref:hypothetical protein n=1 Tax=uncultured Thiodictyon sp. TaxID=1846217 RepID=UPI0025EEC76F|nr:hypothetical protein [uncultured Thiodictyon sp.]
MTGQRFSVDTNILIYSIDHDFAFWDAMLVQAARAAGVTRLLTEDMQDGRVIGAMRLENPFKAGFDLQLV